MAAEKEEEEIVEKGVGETLMFKFNDKGPV